MIRRYLARTIIAGGIIYAVSYLSLTRFLSPEIPTLLGKMIGLGAPRNLDHRQEPPTAEDIRVSNDRINRFTTFYKPVIWINERVTGTYFATADEVYEN